MKTKTFHYNHRRSKQLRQWVQNAIDWHEQLKGAYFFTPNRNASARRRREKEINQENPPFKILMNGGAECIEVEPIYKESARHVHYKMQVTKNGDKRTISELKKLLNGAGDKNAS
jgi:hypothetical protein